MATVNVAVIIIGRVGSASMASGVAATDVWATAGAAASPPSAATREMWMERIVLPMPTVAL